MFSGEIGKNTNCDVKQPNVAAIALMLLVEDLPMILTAERRIIKDKHYLYTMPGGTVETGESIKQGAKRELFEETGLRVRTSDLEMVGAPFEINSSVLIQFMFCHLETAAPWQYVSHTEPNKMKPWRWMNMEQFGNLEELGVYPNIEVTGHLPKILEMTKKRGSLINKYTRDPSWLGWMHERDLRRRYGL